MILAGLLAMSAGPAPAAVTVVYQTGFEEAEGYNPEYTLAGQLGWTNDGTGGNGLFTDAANFPDMGQQAYVGAFPPEDFEVSLAVWRPINLAPIPSNTTLVRFSVEMAIRDSLNGAYDYFDWSVYNASNERLLTIDFDNKTYSIAYLLEGTTQWVTAAPTFRNDVRYRLQILMDFSNNRWSATLGDALIATNQPLRTRTDTALTLGDVDAIWYYEDLIVPGDNFMLFDNYTITREGPLPPTLTPLDRAGNTFTFRLRGEPGRRYAVEATTNFTAWSSLRTNTTDLLDGTFEFTDRDARPPYRFYRGRLVP